MDVLGTIPVFVRVAELGSFTRAAKALGITSSGVGKAVLRLETDLGVRLFHRTTRRLALTAEGALLFERSRHALDELENARSEVSSRSAQARGRLTVSLPVTIGKSVIVPALGGFLAKHEGVHVDLRLTDRKVNLVEDGVDVAVRVGALADSSLVARPIGRQDLLTLAAPSLLAREKIETLDELSLAPAVSFRLPSSGRERPWLFRDGDRPMLIRPRSAIVVDDGEAMVAAAAAGLGVCQVPELMAQGEIARGALVEVLRAHRPPPEPIFAVYTSQPRLPQRIRGFVDFLVRLPGLDPRKERVSDKKA